MLLTKLVTLTGQLDKAGNANGFLTKLLTAAG